MEATKNFELDPTGDLYKTLDVMIELFRTPENFQKIKSTLTTPIKEETILEIEDREEKFPGFMLNLLKLKIIGLRDDLLIIPTFTQNMFEIINYVKLIQKGLKNLSNTDEPHYWYQVFLVGNLIQILNVIDKYRDTNITFRSIEYALQIGSDSEHIKVLLLLMLGF
jgi:hypothetical protein